MPKPSAGQSVDAVPVALQPQPRSDDWWQDRHAQKLAERDALLKKQPIELVFIGDSITHGWEAAGAELWADRFAEHGALNLGFSGDRTEHVLWRLGLGDAGERNNEAADLDPTLYVVMIGTNNTGHGVSSADESAEGVQAIVDRLLEISPSSDVLLLAIFPRGATADDAKRQTNDQINQQISTLGQRDRVEFLDISDEFLDDEGNLPESVMPDQLHPSVEGYRLWADAIEPVIDGYLSAAGAEQ